MNQAKRGRPKLTDPRIHLYRVRLNDEEWEEVQKLIKKGVNVSELFRLFIAKQSNREE